ncbi:hypothetical protein NHL50_15730 [Acidimicrobiia bacterium EGI L10123]|uniref:hypothetical protein n=1 Tax=Salinilacustrithrix flava TaxID=2957203 RepID=UPI003D7C205C|nr:hypothetical protein [Acidimicrobiia bacterium EGI L10123]
MRSPDQIIANIASHQQQLDRLLAEARKPFSPQDVYWGINDFRAEIAEMKTELAEAVSAR